MFLVLPPHPCACERRSSMKVFVAGATGAIGKRLVPQLVASGYEVVAMTRSPKNVEPLRAAGAQLVVADALDRSAVVQALSQAKPEVVNKAKSGQILRRRVINQREE